MVERVTQLENMTTNYNQDQFLNDYFNATRVKGLLFNLISYLGLMAFKNRFPRDPMDMVYLSIMVVIVSIIMSFRPDYLKKEVAKIVGDIDWRQSNTGYLCNCRKFSGPLVGVLKIELGTISFESARDNLADKNFKIEIAEHKNISIEKLVFKRSLIETLRFPQLTNGICLVVDGKKTYLQTFEADRIIDDFEREV